MNHNLMIKVELCGYGSSDFLASLHMVIYPQGFCWLGTPEMRAKKVILSVSKKLPAMLLTYL